MREQNSPRGKHTHLSVNRLNLLQSSQHKDGRLAHPRLGLAQDVHAQDGLGNTLMLD